MEAREYLIHTQVYSTPNTQSRKVLGRQSSPQNPSCYREKGHSLPSSPQQPHLSLVGIKENQEAFPRLGEKKSNLK